MVKKSRNTLQKEIIERCFNSLNQFFTAEDLHNLVKKRDDKIGIATVYRFLKDMKNHNKVYTYFCDRRTIYSREKRSHCHYICENTGKIIHFDIGSLDFLKDIKKKIPGSITSFQLEIHGCCNDCIK
jgi:Fur family ferric uptake transcriptional regulator